MLLPASMWRGTGGGIKRGIDGRGAGPAVTPAKPKAGPARQLVDSGTVMAGQKAGPIAVAIWVAKSLHSIFSTTTLAYRAIPSVVALCSFLALSALYLLGHNDVYLAILRLYGITPFEFPFLDIS